jgi:hypothetical protein
MRAKATLAIETDCMLGFRNVMQCKFSEDLIPVDILIIGFCILLRVILIVNNNTFCFATIDKVFY